MKTYAGIEEKYAIYESSKVCLLPVPYDATSTWGKGADKGPEAFLTASENMEIYDLESDTEVYKKGVWMDSAPNCNVSPEELAKVIKQNAKLRFEDDKLFTMIGGEHSVSIGAIMAAYLAQNDFETVERFGREISIDYILNIPEDLHNGSEFSTKLKALKSLYKNTLNRRGLDTSPLRENLEQTVDENKIRKIGYDLGIVTYNISSFKGAE